MLSGTVFIDRKNNKSAIESMHQAGEDMKRKRISLFIFPEGTRHLSPERDLLPFKKGAFYLAVEAGVPLIPIVCQNYYHLFDGKTQFKSGTVRLKILPPIPTTGLTAADVPSLMDHTRSLMVKTLQELEFGDTSPESSAGSQEALLRNPNSTTYGAANGDGTEDGAAVDDMAEETSNTVTPAAAATVPGMKGGSVSESKPLSIA